MVNWAKGGYDGVRFLMLCVETGADGLRTAQSFGEHFEIPATIVNGYIDTPSERPSFGQLGCGGFIVLGPYGEFVSERTVPAYLKAGPQAFTAVERILSSLGVEPAPVADRSKVDADSNRSEALQLAPVGHAQMDAEHQGLVVAAADLIQQRSLDSLCRLRDLWEQHSQNEEAVFVQHDFGGAQAGGPLSGIASHCQHHRVILERLDSTLGGFGPASDRCVPGSVDEQVVYEIIAEMQRHGDVWDEAYAGKLD